MPKVIISDTSCLIVFSKINELEVLKRLYSEIVTTEEVADEFGQVLPDWVSIQSVKNKHYQEELKLKVDVGEASALALAVENHDSLLIVDDFKARKLATSLGIDIIGSIGILVKAKNEGIIDSVKPFFERIRNTDFRISDDLEAAALKEAGES
jgi:predicted nucleic acid-binding protein